MRDTQWRGYARTAEGNPITLSQARSVVSLSVLGNSTQDGTPSPDNPVEVVGTGVRTGNLFDVNGLQFNKLVNIADGVITVSNMTGTDNLYCAARINFELVAGKQYTVIAKSARQGTGIIAGSYDCAIRLQTNTTYDGLAIDFIGKANNYGIVVNNFIAPDNINDYKYLGTRIYNDTVYTFENIMLIEGEYTSENMPPYEPYGYKVAVTAQGRKLFDAENIVENTEDTTVKIEEYQGKKCLTWTDGDNTTKQRFMQGEFKENTQYTLRFSGYSKNNMQIFIVYTDGSYSGMTIQGGEEWNEIIFQSTSGKSIDYWCGWNNYSQKAAIDIDSATIIEGAYTADTMPPYEPYKPPQSFNVYTPEVLHGVGSAHDSVVIDFDRHKAEFVKAIGFTQLKSSDNWSDNFYPVIYKSLSPTMKGNEYAMCNYMPYADTVNATVKSSNAQGAAIGVYRANTIDGVSDLGSFKAWLSDKDVYAYYPLATSTTTDITALQQWDALPNLKGTWILTAEGGTEPTLKAAYTSNTDPYTDYSDIVSVLPVYPDLDIDTDEPNTSTNEPTSETNNSIDTIDILDLYE